MAVKKFGEPAPRNFDKEVVADGTNVPGLGWKISPETEAALEAIDDNIRLAARRSRDFFFD